MDITPEEATEQIEAAKAARAAKLASPEYRRKVKQRLYQTWVHLRNTR